MRFLFHRKRAVRPVDIGRLVESRALERVRTQAQAQAREILCDYCRDRRCLTGSTCKAVVAQTDSIAWEMVAERAELN